MLLRRRNHLLTVSRRTARLHTKRRSLRREPFVATTHDISRTAPEAEPAPGLVYVIAGRALTLTADAIVLTLASPFFAIWWLVRTARRLLGKV